MLNITLEEVRSQLPEHIREQYPSFAEFVYSYYKFLQEQNPTDLLEVRDIDQTSDEFLAMLKNELASKFGEVSVDERTVLKNIKQYYASKGSEDSITFLFNSVFNERVLLDYPSERMLQPSDGGWNQEISLFVEVVAEQDSPYKFLGQELKIVNNDGDEVFVELQKIQKTEENNILEFFVSRGFYGKIQKGNNIYAGLFVGKLLPTTSKLKIVQGGKGFSVGQTYDLDVAGSSGTRLKIDRVDRNGSVTKASFINFGYGYDLDFTVSLVPQSFKSGSPFTRIGSGIEIKNHNINNSDSGYINEADYLQEGGDGGAGFDPSYVGAIVSRFTAPIGDNTEQKPPDEYCVISVSTSPLTMYPGYWKDNKGMLSDAIYLFDGEYYQNFSYVIKTVRRLEEYKSLLKLLAHPAGYKLFAINDIRSDYDAGSNITSLLQGFLRRFAESVQGVSGEQYKHLEKPLEDQNATEDYNTLDVEKGAFEEQLEPLLDRRYNNFGKGLVDDLPFADNNIIDFGKLNKEDLSLAELIELALDKELFDNQTINSTINKETKKRFEGIESGAWVGDSGYSSGLSYNATVTDNGSIEKLSNYYSVDYGDVTYTEGESIGIVATF